MAERSEAMLSDEHCRDNVSEAELALDRHGRFLALRVRTLANIGAYHTSDRNAGPPTNNLGVLAGTYVIPAIHVEVTGVLTHTMLTGHYRGAGRPEAAYVIETMVDLAARELDIDPAELRRRNTIPADAMPFTRPRSPTPTTAATSARTSRTASPRPIMRASGRRLEQSARRGKLRGIGVSNTVEATNFGLIEHAEMRFDPTGTLTLVIGTHDHGQGHATTFRQIIADKLGHRARSASASNTATPTRSRSAPAPSGRASTVAGGTALVLAADKIIAKGKKIAAHLMEADEHDIAFERGRFTVAGTDKAIGLTEVARDVLRAGKAAAPGWSRACSRPARSTAARAPSPMAATSARWRSTRRPARSTIVRYTAVDDVGRMINPLLVEGQLHGGIAQGVGQALMEDIDYDASGQLVTGSFQDYCMPRADDFCTFALGENEVPTKTNPLGVKGAGESGTVGALPSVMNAVNDALQRIGAPYVQMPATSERIWRAIETAKRGSS